MKMLVCSALRFALVFGLLAWPWPGWRQVVSVCFRAQARFLVGAAFPQHSFRVTTFANPQFRGLDTLVVAADRKRLESDGHWTFLSIPFDSGAQGWIPLAMAIALGLATPLSWSKRWKAIVGGMFLIQLLVAATVLVDVSFSLVDETSPAWKRVPLEFANRILVENIWFGFVAPFLLWAGWLAGGGHWEPIWKRLTGARAPVTTPCSIEAARRRVRAKINSDFAGGDLARWQGASNEHIGEICEERATPPAGQSAPGKAEVIFARTLKPIHFANQ